MIKVIASAALLIGSSAVFYYIGLRRRGRAVDKPKAINEVIFFPDNVTLAGDADMSVKDKGAWHAAEILRQSPALGRLVDHLSSAERSVDLCLYLVTCERLARAVMRLLDAGRGVRVRLIVDEGMAGVRGSLVPQFRARGAHVRMRKRTDYLMHHKFAIVDDNTVVTGSFNWTMQAAMGNWENVVVSSEPDLVRPFVGEFERLWREFAPVKSA